MSMFLGLTGGIACGKSTVAKIFADLGGWIVDADKVAREVVAPGEEGLELVVERFGSGILQEDGQLNRKALGAIIFGDERARLDLNSILHPIIRQRMEKKKEAAKQANPPLIIVDSPLLFEMNQAGSVNHIAVVYIPRNMQLERLMNRDGFSEQEARARIASQMDIEEKRSLANYVIDNSYTVEYTKKQVEDLFKKLT